MKRFLPIFCLLVLSGSPLAAQTGDLPIPPEYEKKLLELGAVEKFLPVQKDTLLPTGMDLKRGWLLYARDRNYEVLPNAKPAPGEALKTLIITVTPGGQQG